MRFTWSPEKKRLNPLKHRGVTFEMAQKAFEDPNCVATENYYYEGEGEQRLQLIGMSGQLLLMVVFVDRSDGGEEVIHLISARRANDYEERIYCAQS